MSKSIQPLYMLKGIAAQHMKQARYSQAVVYFKDILTKFTQEVNQITSEKEMERAIRELELASHKNLSLCYLKQQNYRKCIDQCKVVLDIEPNNIKIIYRIGKSYMQLKNYQTAEHYLKRGFYLDSNEKEIMKALEEIQQMRNAELKQSQAAKWSFFDLLKWLIAIMWAIVTYPLRIFRRQEQPLTPTCNSTGKLHMS